MFLVPYILGLIGGLLNRWRGHGSQYKRFFPRPAPQIAFSLAYAYTAWLSGGLLVGGLVLILTTLAMVTGHGNAHDMGKSPRGEDETLEFTVKWLHGKIPEYWYDVLLMSVLGLAISLPCGIATLNPLIALSGLLKAPAYMIGHYMYDNSPKVARKDNEGKTYQGIQYLPRHLDYATELGEFFTGLFLWTSLFLLA